MQSKNMFSEIQKLKEFTISRPALQEVLKKLLWQKVNDTKQNYRSNKEMKIIKNPKDVI